MLADHIEAAMETVAPNVKELLTAAVGARIISKAGSLARLADCRRAQFRYWVQKRHCSVLLRPEPGREAWVAVPASSHSFCAQVAGKIARAVASKVAIAARIDYYRHNGKDSTVYGKLKIRINEIQEKYREPMPEKERDRKYKEHIQRQQYRAGGRDVARDKHDKRRNKDRRKRFGKRRRY